MHTTHPAPVALATAGAAGSRHRSQRRLGVVVPINPIGVQDRHLLDLDHLGAGAVQHAEALAAARLPLTTEACARMARLEWGRQTLSEHERQQREAGLLHALVTCHAQVEQQALMAGPPVAAPSAAAIGHNATASPAASWPDGDVPGLSPQALRYEQLQAGHRHPLRSELTSGRLRVAIGVVGALLLTAMEASVVSQLNPLLLPAADPTAERTWLAHLAQVLAALVLVTMLGAVRLLAVQAAQAVRPAAQRLACGTGAGLIAASSCLLAAIVTWPAYGPLVEALLSGQSAASGMALEGAAPGAPLWLRLLTAPALLAIGIMAGQMVHMAADAARQVRVLKPRLAELDADLALFQRTRSLADRWVACRGQRLAPAQVQRQVEEACTSAFQAYLDGLQPHRWPPVAAHLESAAERLRRQANDLQIDAMARTAAQAFCGFTAWGDGHATASGPTTTAAGAAMPSAHLHQR
jgi:hypothetical protein